MLDPEPGAGAPDITIHLVDPACASLLDRVDDDVFDHAVRPELLREFLESSSNVLVVAVAEGLVVGMATGIAYVHPDKPLSLFINEVGVSARHRQRGIGRRLVVAVLEWACARGCVEAWVATEGGNIAARSLYLSTGAVQDEEPAVVYVYPLSQGSRRENLP
ncbi:MAG: GNAT family N-acetyltransferase [Burkholderiaceae bacterium]